MNACILIGEPGAGKTTLAQYLTAIGGQGYVSNERPVPHRVYSSGVVEVGRRRPGLFSGTDALAMSIQPQFLEWIGETRPTLLFFEGDRLANEKCFEALKEFGYTLTVYDLWGSRVAAAQRAARGTEQNPAWLAGRRTKVHGLRTKYNAVILPAGQPVAALAERMNDPVARALKEVQP